jgi:hypothetical protein
MGIGDKAKNKAEELAGKAKAGRGRRNRQPRS